MTVWTDTKQATDSLAETRTGAKMSGAGIASMCGFTETEVRYLISQGAPAEQDGDGYTIDAAQFIVWLQRQARDRGLVDLFSGMRHGVLVKVRRLSAITGYSVSAIENHIRQGAPTAFKRRAGVAIQIETAQYIAWLIEQELSRRAATIPNGKTDVDFKNRRMAAQAKLMELNLEEREGKLVDMDRVTNLVHHAITVSKTRLLSIPTKLAPQITGQMNAAVVKEMLDESIIEALNELARIKETDLIPWPVDVSMASAATGDGQSVGR